MVENLNTAVIYHKILNLEDVATVVNCRGIFKILTPVGGKSNKFLLSFFEIVQH